MINLDIILELHKCFPNSFINSEGEFIAHQYANQYFIIRNCETEMDIKCKVLEWFSRGAYKTTPYSSKKKNDELHAFMLNGINKYLGTNFSHKDMEVIYTYLGNCCNHSKTVAFVESGYDMNILEERRKEDG